jgi:hypothetical protein
MKEISECICNRCYGKGIIYILNHDYELYNQNRWLSYQEKFSEIKHQELCPVCQGTGFIYTISITHYEN